MAGFALPKLRWLLAGGLAAGVWVVTQEKGIPRPPARVPVSMPSLALPKSVARPPARPEKIVTGSIARPDKVRLLQAVSTVNMRARAEIGAPIVTRLGAGQTVRDLAHAGEWRLVMAGDKKGWVHGAYLRKPVQTAVRPPLPVPGKAATTKTQRPQ